MSSLYRVATIFGGTGFIGRQVVRELAQRGITIKIATRVPERAFFLKTCGTPGQIVPVACRYDDPESIAAAIKGSDYVINCIGLLFEKRKATFQRAHVEIPAAIARACAENKVERFVHLSALGIENSNSNYAKTKKAGEEAVRAAFPKATILRPSVVFGPEDNFFNKFAALSKIAPFLPLIGGGKTRFQPVYVGDVADAVRAALTLPALPSSDPRGKTFELGGPEAVDFKEIYARLFRFTGCSRPLVALSWGLARMQAFFLGMLPTPLLTRDQVELLHSDAVVSENALTFYNLGLVPTAMDVILPTYLERFRPGGRFAEKVTV